MRQRIRAHLTYANVMATLAVFLVLSGGTAVALSGSNTVFTDDIVNGQVMAADIGDGAVKSSDIGVDAVDSSKIADESMKGRDVLNDNLTGADIAPNSLKGADIDESTLSSIGGGGPAGGDLTGTYPNPQIAPDAVGTGEVANNSLRGADIAESTLGHGSVRNGTLVGVTPPLPAGATSFGIECADVHGDIAYSEVSAQRGVDLGSLGVDEGG